MDTKKQRLYEKINRLNENIGKAEKLFPNFLTKGREYIRSDYIQWKEHYFGDYKVKWPFMHHDPSHQIRIKDIDVYTTGKGNFLVMLANEVRHITPIVMGGVTRNLYIIFNDENTREDIPEYTSGYMAEIPLYYRDVKEEPKLLPFELVELKETGNDLEVMLKDEKNNKGLGIIFPFPQEPNHVQCIQYHNGLLEDIYKNKTWSSEDKIKFQFIGRHPDFMVGGSIKVIY